MKKWIALAAALMLTLASCTAVAEAVSPLSREWFMQEDAVVPGRAHVEITFDTDTVYPDENGENWFYVVYLSEVNGVPFTVEEYACTYFYGKEVFVDMQLVDAQTFAQWTGSNTLKGFSQVHFNGGMPVQDIDGMAVVVRGHDANGVACAFRGYVNFSKESR